MIRTSLIGNPFGAAGGYVSTLEKPAGNQGGRGRGGRGRDGRGRGGSGGFGSLGDPVGTSGRAAAETRAGRGERGRAPGDTRGTGRAKDGTAIGAKGGFFGLRGAIEKGVDATLGRVSGATRQRAFGKQAAEARGRFASENAAATAAGRARSQRAAAAQKRSANLGALASRSRAAFGSFSHEQGLRDTARRSAAAHIDRLGTPTIAGDFAFTGHSPQAKAALAAQQRTQATQRLDARPAPQPAAPTQHQLAGIQSHPGAPTSGTPADAYGRAPGVRGPITDPSQIEGALSPGERRSFDARIAAGKESIRSDIVSSGLQTALGVVPAAGLVGKGIVHGIQKGYQAVQFGRQVAQQHAPRAAQKQLAALGDDAAKAAVDESAALAAAGRGFQKAGFKQLGKETAKIGGIGGVLGTAFSSPVATEAGAESPGSTFGGRRSPAPGPAVPGTGRGPTVGGVIGPTGFATRDQRSTPTPGVGRIDNAPASAPAPAGVRGVSAPAPSPSAPRGPAPSAPAPGPTGQFASRSQRDPYGGRVLGTPSPAQPRAPVVAPAPAPQSTAKPIIPPPLVPVPVIAPPPEKRPFGRFNTRSGGSGLGGGRKRGGVGATERRRPFASTRRRSY